MTRKYIYKDEKEGTREEVPIERWAWGAIYRPTEAQLAEAEKRREERNEGYREEIRLRRKAMEERGDIDEATIKAMEEDFKGKMQHPYEPERDELHQFGADGVFHRIGEIDQERVERFVMYKPEDPKKRVEVLLFPGMKLIHKYRMVKPWYLDDFVRVYIIGFKDGSEHHFNFILPDDRVISANREDIDLVRFKLTKPI